MREPRKENPMQFMLMFKETAAEYGRHDDPAALPAYFGAWGAYVGAIQQSGIVVSGNGLLPPRTATHVRTVGGKRQVQEAAFAHADEQLGGYFIVETASLDEALEWAAKAPCASAGSVEVRPVLPPPTNAPA